MSDSDSDSGSDVVRNRTKTVESVFSEQPIQCSSEEPSYCTDVYNAKRAIYKHLVLDVDANSNQGQDPNLTDAFLNVVQVMLGSILQLLDSSPASIDMNNPIPSQLDALLDETTRPPVRVLMMAVLSDIQKNVNNSQIKNSRKEFIRTVNANTWLMSPVSENE